MVLIPLPSTFRFHFHSDKFPIIHCQLQFCHVKHIHTSSLKHIQNFEHQPIQLYSCSRFAKLSEMWYFKFYKAEEYIQVCIMETKEKQQHHEFSISSSYRNSQSASDAWICPKFVVTNAIECMLQSDYHHQECKYFEEESR